MTHALWVILDNNAMMALNLRFSEENVNSGQIKSNFGTPNLLSKTCPHQFSVKFIKQPISGQNSSVTDEVTGLKTYRR